MLCIPLCIFILINLVFGDNLNLYSRDNENNLACPDSKICIPVDYCSDMMVLINDATLPIHQFRQAICGYIGKNPKVCCSYLKQLGNIIPNNNPYFSVESSQDCGKSLVKSSVPTMGSYPFLVRIGFINLNDGNLKYSCTGTIINERTILTTATCALATAHNYKLHSVLVGEFDSAENPDCNELFCAHCALTAQPICYSDDKYIVVGSTPILVGWGKLSGNKDSTEQHAFFMKILNSQDCREFIDRGLSVELCTIGREKPCSGFSGSPLIHYNGHRYSVIGLLSYGSSCNSNNNPLSVFVNIQKYTVWIRENS
ncbi:hypothetical protein PV327_006661 [Microctonus hyperodae]|uniref:Peptidase S1 domain-containing protein n=1 Tax=Microctonus hyperodae TaxID=165561 RepID=A0AA39F4W5_MICHY|nr:hypothetical protein PV327_006661 [Microctonus hyperodae]